MTENANIKEALEQMESFVRIFKNIKENMPKITISDLKELSESIEILKQQISSLNEDYPNLLKSF